MLKKKSNKSNIDIVKYFFWIMFILIFSIAILILNFTSNKLTTDYREDIEEAVKILTLNCFFDTNNNFLKEKFDKNNLEKCFLEKEFYSVRFEFNKEEIFVNQSFYEKHKNNCLINVKSNYRCFDENLPIIYYEDNKLKDGFLNIKMIIRNY